LEVTKQYSKSVALNIVFQRISFAVHRGVAKQLVDRMESGIWRFNTDNSENYR
jgi:hypothetical protein